MDPLKVLVKFSHRGGFAKGCDSLPERHQHLHCGEGQQLYLQAFLCLLQRLHRLIYVG